MFTSQSELKNFHPSADTSVIEAGISNAMDYARQLSLQLFADTYRKKIESLLAAIGNNQTVNLEGGHIYSDEIPSIMHLMQLRVTALLKEFILNAGKGHSIVSTLFVDNYHPVEHPLDVGNYMQIAQGLGMEFDACIMEADLAPEAGANCEKLVLAHKAELHKGNLVLRATKSHLKKSDGTLSCGLLDATLSVQKLQEADTGIIVLPPEYKAQQKNMRSILAALLACNGGSGEIHSFFAQP